MNNIFYVYVYLDPRKPGTYIYDEYQFDYEPFYVGKGKEYRMYYHLHSEDNNKLKVNKIKKINSLNLQPVIIKYAENMIECQSFKLEMDMIKTIGRYDLGLGPLTNLTNGGEGILGYQHTEEMINYLSLINSGTNNRMFGKKHTEESKLKESKTHKYLALLPDYNNGMQNKHHTEESKLKQSKIRKYNMSLPDYEHPMQNKHHTEESRKLQSEIKKYQVSLSNYEPPMQNKHHTEETRTLMREKKLGHKDSEYTKKLRRLKISLTLAKKKNDLEKIKEFEEQIRIHKETQ